ncbi:hypothetical protein GCM10023170_025090 [Phytohabitans houttuyneae]|uniref:YybH family protein n=1 Tax=Phytohabitans houttuyneae TaxID=1076126 RepID=UPI0031E6B9D1
MASAEDEVRDLFGRQAEAMRAKDIDRLMAMYAPDVVYFDVVPPLRFAGPAALRDRFTRWFDSWESALAIEVRDLRVVVRGDIAFAHWFSRASGTLRGGRQAGSWLRVTSCCERSGGGWLIGHEHVSIPVDLASGSAATALVPE